MEYENPDENINERSYFPQKSSRFKQIMDALIFEFTKKSNPSYYCPIHHSVETRNSVVEHESCNPFTRSAVIGKFSSFSINLLRRKLGRNKNKVFRRL